MSTYETMPEVVKVRVDGPVRIVTLNRPEQLNAFDLELHDVFPRVWSTIERDREARAVVLTGAGRAFCAGGSLDDLAESQADFHARRQSFRDTRRLIDEMLNVPLPIVAAVNGPAVGMGCTLMTLCDVVLIAEDTFVADPHVNVALVAGDGSAAGWPSLTGLLQAKRYLLTGDRIPAPQAVEMGLATQTVPTGSVVDEAVRFAHRLADLPPQAVQDTKMLLNQPLREAMARLLWHGMAAESQSFDTDGFAASMKRMRSGAETAR